MSTMEHLESDRSSSIADPLGIAFGAAVMGLVLAGAAQLAATAATPISAAELARVTLLRDLLLRTVVPAAGFAAIGRVVTQGAAVPEPLVRLGVLTRVLTVVGIMLLLVGAGLADGAALLVSCGGVALIAAATAQEAVALLLRAGYARAVDGMARTSTRVAAAVALVTLPLTIVVLALTATERVARVSLWRGVGADLSGIELALRDATATFLPLALLASIGILLDTVGAAARRSFIAPGSTRSALWALGLFGCAAWLGHLFGGDAAQTAALHSFFSLALLIPGTVLCGNAIATLAQGKLDPRAVAWSGVALAICLVERSAVGVPLALADVGAALDRSALFAAGIELELAALAFALVMGVGFRGGATTLRPAVLRTAGILAFVGVQLALGARLANAALPRGFLSLPRLRHGELVATFALVLGLGAATLLVSELARVLRARRAR